MYRVLAVTPTKVLYVQTLEQCTHLVGDGEVWLLLSPPNGSYGLESDMFWIQIPGE